MKMNSNLVSFWLIALFIALACLLLIYITSRGNANGGLTRETATNALKDAQLLELETSFKSGQIDASNYDLIKSEITRAYARAKRRGEDGVQIDGSNNLLWGIIIASFICAFGLYNYLGAPGYPDFGLEARYEIEHPSQKKMLEMLADNNAIPIAPELDADTAQLLTKLKEAIAKKPDVAEGYYHLRRLHYSTRNFHEASIAGAKYIELMGEKTTSDDYAMQAESLVISANGYVSPEANLAIKQALKLDPKNIIATYYMAMSLKADERISDAKTVLTQLLARDLANPDWKTEIKKQIAELDVKLNAAKGPSAKDIANAANMSTEDRMEMIGGMVDGLKARLGSEGGTPEEWARLVSSLRTLGRDIEAKAILGEALSKFPDNQAIKALNK